MLAALVNPLGGGTAPGITVTTSVLQRWQQLQAVCKVTGKEKGLKFAHYEGVATNWIGVAGGDNENVRKEKLMMEFYWWSKHMFMFTKYVHWLIVGPPGLLFRVGQYYLGAEKHV